MLKVGNNTGHYIFKDLSKNTSIVNYKMFVHIINAQNLQQYRALHFQIFK